jgi:hypothetical protein
MYFELHFWRSRRFTIKDKIRRKTASPQSTNAIALLPWIIPEII